MGFGYFDSFYLGLIGAGSLIPKDLPWFVKRWEFDLSVIFVSNPSWVTILNVFESFCEDLLSSEILDCDNLLLVSLPVTFIDFGTAPHPGLKGSWGFAAYLPKKPLLGLLCCGESPSTP